MWILPVLPDNPYLPLLFQRHKPCNLRQSRYVRRFREDPAMPRLWKFEESRRGPVIRTDKPAIGSNMKGSATWLYTSMCFSRVRI